MDREQLRSQFLDMISDYSESTWCAGWMDGVENEVREIGGTWVAIAAACGGWPIGYRAIDGWTDGLSPEEYRFLADERGIECF